MSDDERSPPVERHVGSDSDDVDAVSTKKRRRIADPDEDDEDVKDVKEVDAKVTAANDEDDGDNDEDDDEDEDDDDEDDEDEDDEDVGADGERRRKRRKRNKNRNRFLDVEAVVDDEEDEEDEEDDYGDVAEFIEEGGDAGQADTAQHRRLDRAIRREEEPDVEEILRGIKERHGRQARYNGDSDSVPQRLLMPGVDDPSLWQVRVKTGRERAIILSVFRKVFYHERRANPIDVISCFYRDSLPGLIYFEARQSAAVSAAITGIVGVYASRGIQLVPIEEMAPLLRIKKKEVTLVPGMWVRLKRGHYAGDLGQVVDVERTTSGQVGVKFIPRINMTPKETRREQRLANGGKAPAGRDARPPQRLFAYEEVRKVYGRSQVRPIPGGGHAFDGDEYIDGFCIRDIRVSQLATDDVKPTLEEISKFTGDDGSTDKLDLSAIADANRSLSTAVLSPGDQVEVYEGEQAGLYGTVEAITPDTISIRAVGGDIHGQTVEVPARSVRKKFDVGEHVKVTNGKNADVSGMVVEVKGDVVTLMSDQGQQEIKVFSKDIRRATDVAGGLAPTGQYDLHDLVMLDSTTAAVIIKVEGSMLNVLDQNGIARIVRPQEVTLRRDSTKYAVATDSQGQDMRVGDAMKETEGEQRRGEVISIFRSLFVFLSNREIPENNGVFVARAEALVSVTPRSAVADLTKINPALNQQLPYGGASLMPPPSAVPNRNRLVNTLVVVVKGTYKGLMGVIKDFVGDNARVELATNNKTISIGVASLKRKDPKTGLTYPLDLSSMGGYGAGGGMGQGSYGANPYGGGVTPAPNGGRTPAAGFGGRTPAPQFGRTPNPYAGGGKTPNPYASGMGGKTPNPYAAGAGGRTPAPGWAAGGKTPAWAGASGGGKTPAHGLSGGQTPAWAGAGGAGGKTPNPYAAAGGRTPAPPGAGGMYADPGTSRYPVSAPTPYGGPPTNAPISAPTPAAGGGYSAPTPYAAPTPYSAPTPGAGLSAPTPGAIGGPTPYGAPTPYAGGFGAPTPAAPTPFGGAPPGAAAPGPEGIAWDWALDFRNVLVEVGPSQRPATRNPLHFQRGLLDKQHLGIESIAGENVQCQVLAGPQAGESVEVPAEYLRPVRPNAPGQVVVFITRGADGTDHRGQQRTTQYESDGQWMMEQAAGDAVSFVMDERSLARIWRA